MTRTLLIYALLVFLPSAALAALALRVADRDHEERVAELRSRLDEEAGALARRIGASLLDAAGRAESEQVTAFARDGRSIAYSLEPPAEPEGDPPAAAEDLRWYRLSMRGGESYELSRGDPGRALDAYAFYLPRIRSPELRSRLRFASARAALAAGKTGLGEALLSLAAGRTELGEALLARVFEEGEGAATEEGLPIDLLAASRLLSCGGREALRAKASVRLREQVPHLSTPLLAALAEAIVPGDAELARLIDKRRALVAAIAAHPGLLTSAGEVLDGDLLLARPVAAGDGRPPALAVTLVRAALPPLEAGGLEAMLGPPGSAGAEGNAEAAHAIRLGKAGPALAILRVRDPALGMKLASLERRRDVHRAGVALLALVTLGGGVALVRFIARERHLARLRARLLANVSHELKTPITSIRMFSEMLAGDALEDGQARRFGEILRGESLRLSQLAENLLDVSRPAGDLGPMETEPVDLAALLAGVARAFAYRAAEMDVEFRLEEAAGGGDGFIASTSAPAVERVVLNLLDNALKYRRKDSPRIRLSLEKAGEEVRIAVADNGIGIPRRDIERVFEEFYRVRYEDYGVKGSGLGLTIARRLARRLGGDVTVESREGEGSTFTLRLPAGDGS